METHLHVIQPFQAPAVQHERRRRERESAPFELERGDANEDARETATSDARPASASRAANEEGVGLTVDVEA